jgi:flagellar basal-body rod protein FlgC
MTMGYQYSFAISAAGMDIERLRVEVATMNLGNAHTVVASNGSGYVPMRVIAQPAVVAQGQGSFAAQVTRGLTLPAAVVESTGAAVRRAIEPGHPMADASGFVSYPGVDTTAEMMTMMTALRAYEANVAAMNAGRTMALKALEIGGGQ